MNNVSKDNMADVTRRKPGTLDPLTNNLRRQFSWRNILECSSKFSDRRTNGAQNNYFPIAHLLLLSTQMLLNGSLGSTTARSFHPLPKRSLEPFNQVGEGRFPFTCKVIEVPQIGTTVCRNPRLQNISGIGL